MATRYSKRKAKSIIYLAAYKKEKQKTERQIYNHITNGEKILKSKCAKSDLAAYK